MLDLRVNVFKLKGGTRLYKLALLLTLSYFASSFIVFVKYKYKECKRHNKIIKFV